MLQALARSQPVSQRRSWLRGAAARRVDRALADLFGRLPVSVRAPARASAYSVAREAAARPESEASRCACGGTCPKCRAETQDDVLEREPPAAPHAAAREAAYWREAEGDAAGDDVLAAKAAAASQAPVSGSEEDPVLEFSNGTTSCDRDSGTMSTVISTTACTRPCTEAHEADHRAYRGTCCSAYAAARTAAIAAGDTARRNSLTRRYNAWVSSTSDFSECRAYRVSVACGERMERDLNCGTPTDENRSCCGEVGSYLSSMRSSRDSHCPGTDQACPDFST